MPLLIVENVVKYFDSRKVLDIPFWKIDNPGIYSLLGPNGAGKTTFLNIVVGVLNPDGGRVVVKGFLPIDEETRKIVGYLPQEPGLIDTLTGYDNAVFYGRLYGLSPRDIVKKLKSIAERLGLTDRDLGMKVGKYSGGMKKKLALAIALLHDPEILVLDEPTTGMDPATRIEVWSMLLEFRKSGKTVLLATHHMDEADKLSDRVAIMDSGRIVAEGTPEELKKRFGPRTVAILKISQIVDEGVVEVLKRYTDGYQVDEDFVKVHLDEPDKQLPKLLGELYTYNYFVTEFKLVKPTLEDVFLRLTGKRLKE